MDVAESIRSSRVIEVSSRLVRACGAPHHSLLGRRRFLFLRSFP